MLTFSNYFFFSLTKKLRIGLQPNSGRNFSGHICVHSRRGGIKRNYIFVDFYRRVNSFGRICKIIKIPLFSSFLAGVLYDNGLFSYILLADNVSIGDVIYSGSIINSIKCMNKGSSIPLNTIDLFTLVNNLEIKPFKGAQITRSAGNSAILVSKNKNLYCLKLRSGWNIILDKKCICTLGIVSNIQYKLNDLGKAGNSFLLGKRPIVRGVAMNPCDHPHGGGEGKKSPPVAHRSP
jgi:large subunit ribosomal protein L2